MDRTYPRRHQGVPCATLASVSSLSRTRRPGRVLVPPAAARPLGLLLGYLADLAFGDPRRWHPVAGLGQAMAELERRLYADRRSAGLLHVGIAVGATVSLSAATERLV